MAKNRQKTPKNVQKHQKIVKRIRFQHFPFLHENMAIKRLNSPIRGVSVRGL